MAEAPSDISNTNIEYFHGDLFSTPPKSILGHSCNCMGSWGAGIALQFKRRHPDAFKQYKDHCAAHAGKPEELLGTCLLIHSKTYWIACLFTSVGNSSSNCGRPRSSKDDIVEATRLALADLLRQLHGERYISELQPGDDYFPVINIPQINAGLFCVPWNETESVIKTFPYKFHVYIYP